MITTHEPDTEIDDHTTYSTGVIVSSAPPGYLFIAEEVFHRWNPQAPPPEPFTPGETLVYAAMESLLAFGAINPADAAEVNRRARSHFAGMRSSWPARLQDGGAPEDGTLMKFYVRGPNG